jgi:hypothetical protein
MYQGNISFSTVGKWLFMLAILTIVLPVMLEMARNIWLNYGWSHPWLSSLVAAILGIAAWWMFGGLVSLSIRDRDSAKSSSPTVQQSATASGGSTITQVGGDLTVNQGGLSEEDRNMIRGLVKQKSFDEMADLTRRYRYGYLIFGLSPDGKPVTYQGELLNVRIDVNWSDLRVSLIDSGSRMQIFVPAITVQFQQGSVDRYWNNVETQPFVENEPIPSLTVPGMFYEVLNVEKRIFLIGFK